MTALARFARAVDTLFSHLGVAATYIPAIGANAAVLLIPKRPDQIIGLGSSDVLAEAVLFDLRISEVEEPRVNDVILYDGRQYRVIGEPRRDIHRLVWTVEAEAS